LILIFYRFSHKTNKWWKKVLYTWLTISFANCYTLYSFFYKKKKDIREFQEELIRGILKATECLSLQANDNLMNDHYPAKIMTGLKRCKVCYYNSTTQNCPKTSYRCFRCSLEMGKDISLCVLCFGEFHNDRRKYLNKKDKDEHL